MIVDTFPQDSKRSARASSLSTSTSSPSSSTSVQSPPSIQTVQQNHDLPLDDDAPPPYEFFTPTLVPQPQSQPQPQPQPQPEPQPRAASIVSGKSIRRSVDVPQPWSGEIDLITSTPESPHISPSNPTEHVAPSFLRPIPRPSSDATYERLPEPFVIDAKPGVVELSDSFAPWDMPALHKHDVQKEDWEQLLRDVQSCAKLCGGQRIVSAALPVTRHLGPPGHIASYFAAQGLKKQKTSDVSALLDVWNERFFHPRRLEIILCRGDKRKSGSGKDIEFLAPDRMSTFSSSSSSMSSRSYRGGCGRQRRSRCGRDVIDEEEKTYRLVLVST